jgi:hypothetical protein
MSYQPSNPVPAPTTPAGGEYYTSPPAYALTPAPSPYGNYYQNNGFVSLVSVTTSAASTENSGEGENNAWNGQISCPSRDQAAIIALGVVCGLLAIGLAVLLFFMFFRGHQEQKKMEGELVISSGGKHRHRSGRTEYSRGTSDDMTDYLFPHQKHRSQRRSQPVTLQEFEGLQRPAMAARWANAGVQPPPAAYAQFANPGGPVYFQPGQGTGQAVPVGQVPMPASASQPRRGTDDFTSATEQSEVSSRGESQVPRRTSVRRNQSRTSSSQGGRSGRIRLL